MSDLIGGGIDSLSERLRRGEVGNGGGGAFWSPEPGDVLEGVVTHMDMSGKSNYHARALPKWVVRADDGRAVTVTGLRTVLEREMNESGAQVGDRVALIYRGTVPKKSDPTATVHKYALAVERAAQAAADNGSSEAPF